MNDGQKRVCVSCGADISSRGKASKYCEECALVAKRKYRIKWVYLNPERNVIARKKYEIKRKAKRQQEKIQRRIEEEARKEAERKRLMSLRDKVVHESVDAAGNKVQWRGRVCGSGGYMHHD